MENFILFLAPAKNIFEILGSEKEEDLKKFEAGVAGFVQRIHQNRTSINSVDPGWVAVLAIAAKMHKNVITSSPTIIEVCCFRPPSPTSYLLSLSPSSISICSPPLPPSSPFSLFSSLPLPSPYLLGLNKIFRLFVRCSADRITLGLVKGLTVPFTP